MLPGFEVNKKRESAKDCFCALFQSTAGCTADIDMMKARCPDVVVHYFLEFFAQYFLSATHFCTVDVFHYILTVVSSITKVRICP